LLALSAPLRRGAFDAVIFLCGPDAWSVLSSHVASVDARRLAPMVVRARSEKDVECIAIGAGSPFLLSLEFHDV
jgi:hypothetical protein